MPDIFDQFEEATSADPKAQRAVDYAKEKAAQAALGAAYMGAKAVAPETVRGIEQTGREFASDVEALKRSAMDYLFPKPQFSDVAGIPGMNVRVNPNIPGVAGLLGGQLPQPTADVSYRRQMGPGEFTAGATVDPRVMGLLNPYVGYAAQNPFGLGGTFEAGVEAPSTTFDSLNDITARARYSFRF
jgi:hypothetical protein